MNKYTEKMNIYTKIEEQANYTELCLKGGYNLIFIDGPQKIMIVKNIVSGNAHLLHCDATISVDHPEMTVSELIENLQK